VASKRCAPISMAGPCEPIASAAAVRSDSEVAKSVAESLCLRPVGTINVLVVEDDEMQRLVLDKLFTAANGKNDGIVTFDVTFAATAAEAVATLEAPKCVQFSIILLDMMLPDLNGYDLLPKIRALVGESVAILVASLHTQIELVQLCVSRGADAFLVKPLGSDEVRHIWQFVKGLPSACRSYASDLAEAAVVADEESPVVRYSAMLPRPAAAGAATCAVAHQVCVCGGSSSEGSCPDSRQPRSAHAPYQGPREHPLYPPVRAPGTSSPHDAACSALEARFCPPLAQPAPRLLRQLVVL